MSIERLQEKVRNLDEQMDLIAKGIGQQAQFNESVQEFMVETLKEIVKLKKGLKAQGKHKDWVLKGADFD